MANVYNSKSKNIQHLKVQGGCHRNCTSAPCSAQTGSLRPPKRCNMRSLW